MKQQNTSISTEGYRSNEASETIDFERMVTLRESPMIQSTTAPQDEGSHHTYSFMGYGAQISLSNGGISNYEDIHRDNTSNMERNERQEESDLEDDEEMQERSLEGIPYPESIRYSHHNRSQSYGPTVVTSGSSQQQNSFILPQQHPAHNQQQRQHYELSNLLTTAPSLSSFSIHQATRPLSLSQSAQPYQRSPQEHHQQQYQQQPQYTDHNRVSSAQSARRSQQQQHPQQMRYGDPEGAVNTSQEHYTPSSRPAFLSQPVYQLACAACIRPLCVRAMKAVMLSDHSKELYSTDMPPAGLQLVNEDRQVRHCACRIRDSACLGCGQVVGYHVTQPCSGCLNDQNNGHFWMFYSSAVYHYKRNRIDGSTGDVMLWANVPPISHDQALSRQLRLEVPILSIRTTSLSRSRSRVNTDADTAASNDDRPLTASVEMDEWLNSPVTEVICR